MDGHRLLSAVIAGVQLAIVTLAASIAPAWGQASDGRIPTVSRLVVLFTEQEIRLAERIRARDVPGAGALLTDDFELRSSARPGRPVPRAEWLSQSMKSPVSTVTPTEMAVHDLGSAAVVSFLQPSHNAKATVFVIDVWRRDGDLWKLAVRYEAPSGSSPTGMPGVPPAEPQIPKRY